MRKRIVKRAKLTIDEVKAIADRELSKYVKATQSFKELVQAIMQERQCTYEQAKAFIKQERKEIRREVMTDELKTIK